MSKTYIHNPITEIELRDLAELAQEEIEAFFIRNPHLKSPYQERFVAAALCQGSALHYIGGGYGVGDFDIHFFYRQNPDKLRLSRTVKRINANIGQFKKVPIDFIRTVIPVRLNEKVLENEKILIREFLHNRPTINSRYLSKNPVVGLLPDFLFGEVLWD